MDNMLFNPNSKGLELLEAAIRENAHTMSSELLEALSRAYDVTNEEMEENHATDWYDVAAHAHDFVRDVDKKIKGIFEKVEGLLEEVNSDDEIYDSIYKGVVAEIEKYEYEDYEYVPEFDSIDRSKEQMGKMMKMGYRFNCEASKDIQREHDEKVLEDNRLQEEKRLEDIRKKEIAEKEKQDRVMYEKWKELYGKESPIILTWLEKVDSEIYRVRSYESSIDARYNTNTKKVSGKGSRNHKNEIIECVNSYIQFIEGVSTIEEKTS